MFCADLSRDEQSGLMPFVRENPVKPGTLYIWFTGAYQDPRYPTLPMYYHEYLELASIGEYRAWSEEEKQRNVRALHEQRRREIQQQGHLD
jgi:hypothetical protein